MGHLVTLVQLAQLDHKVNVVLQAMSALLERKVTEVKLGREVHEVQLDHWAAQASKVNRAILDPVDRLAVQDQKELREEQGRQVSLEFLVHQADLVPRARKASRDSLELKANQVIYKQ